MGNHRPVRVACWERFLRTRGCAFDRIQASHHVWKCINCYRSIIFRGAEKEVPADHLRTNLRSLGIPFEEFLGWIGKNC